MKEQKKQFKVGNKVKIINPEFFVRAGYPLCLKDAEEKLNKELGKEIDALILKVSGEKEGFESVAGLLLDIGSKKYDSCRWKILNALARLYLPLNDFGGRERKVYTEIKPELKDKIYTVIKKSFKISGTYVSGSGGGYDSYGEYDYDPSYLTNRKRHALLHLIPENKFFQEEIPIIEDIHVEKLS